MSGKVYLVGAGPGDPGLMTLRGRALLDRTDVVVYDHLVSPRILDWITPTAERIYAGKQSANHTLTQDEINRLLIDYARAGRTVVRLKGGDPFVFGRGGEEALALHEAGIAFEIVPGVTAGLAAPACAGIPVTHRQISSGVILVTGHEAPGKETSSLDWPLLARWQGTLVFYMAMENLAAICQALIENGMQAGMPAAVIASGTTPGQRTVAGTVGDIAEATRQANLAPPAIVVIGRVAELRQSLKWFEDRPLFGRRIVVTRPRQQAQGLVEKFEELGAEVILAPVIRIAPIADAQPLRDALSRIETFDWIVFTSGNAVDAFFELLFASGHDAPILHASQIAAIGPATADRLKAFGLQADLVPEHYTTVALAEAMAQRGGLAGCKVLCPHSDIAPPGLTTSLQTAGAQVTEVVAYRTVGEHDFGAELKEKLHGGQNDWLTFASASAVDQFFACVDPGAVRDTGARIAVIGPMSTSALAKHGLTATVEAKEHTADGLVHAIVEYHSKTTE